MSEFVFTSESVTEGHPDKICDQISDAILDALLVQDPESRVACETVVNTGLCLLTGEITSKAKVDYIKIARQVIQEIGYEGAKSGGFDANSCAILVALDEQSPDIAQGVDEADDNNEDYKNNIGAGDQGIMFGYACDETPELMPLPISLAHRLARQLSKVRHQKKLNYLLPDGKTQVSVNYKNGLPESINTIVISTQHLEIIDGIKDEKTIRDKITDDLWNHVVIPVTYDLEIKPTRDKTRFLVNPTGKFVVGGPQGDAGLTGRKIIVDTYGGYARHGGGAFSGKDPTKVDRSAAYAARYVAKSIVKAELAKKVEVQLSYAIGVANPISILIETFGTEIISQNNLIEIIKNNFDLRPASILEEFDLRNLPKKMGGDFFIKTASYGHFGREDLSLPWEMVDEKSQELIKAANNYEKISK